MTFFFVLYLFAETFLLYSCWKHCCSMTGSFCNWTLSRVGVMNQSGDYVSDNISASSPALILANTCQSYSQAWSYSTAYHNRQMLYACVHLWQFTDLLCSQWMMASVFVSLNCLFFTITVCFAYIPLLCCVRFRLIASLIAACIYEKISLALTLKLNIVHKVKVGRWQRKTNQTL